MLIRKATTMLEKLADMDPDFLLEASKGFLARSET